MMTWLSHSIHSGKVNCSSGTEPILYGKALCVGKKKGDAGVGEQVVAWP
jgi:hypothetical protein